MAILRAHRLFWAAVVLIVLVAGGVVLFSRLHLVSDAAPGAIETAVARRIVVLSIPHSARSQSNPLTADAGAWRDGAEHFMDHCAVCHGRDGRGDSEFARKMYPPVPDLADPAIQQMSDGALFAIIQNGVRWTGMPAFRQEDSAEETWKLVSFIRRVPTLKAADLQPPAVATRADAATKSDAADAGRTIAMDGTAFVPEALTVAVGETVTWVNKDPFPHNVTAGHRRFRSPDLDPDARWTFTPTAAGRFDYQCTLHPGMRGTLIVKPTANKKEQ